MLGANSRWAKKWWPLAQFPDRPALPLRLTANTKAQLPDVLAELAMVVPQMGATAELCRGPGEAPHQGPGVQK